MKIVWKRFMRLFRKGADEDWRLQGQEVAMIGLTFVRRPYKSYSKDWDHDHCAFCWAKFMESRIEPDILTEGYATPDSHKWVCPSCFDDFKEQFEWEVIGQ